MYNEEYLLTEDGGNECSARLRPQSPTIAEEQNLIKESLKEALASSDDDNDNEMWGGLFQKRHKTQAEVVCVVLYRIHEKIKFAPCPQWDYFFFFMQQ